MMELRIYYLNTSMKPPSFLEISDELLHLFKQACEKYIADGSKNNPLVEETVVSLLLGEEWPICSGLIHDFAKGIEQYFVDSLFDLLPLETELKSKKPGKNRKLWHDGASQKLNIYLNETSKKHEH